MGRRAEDPVARFLRFVDRRGDDECWPWLGAYDGQGYGSFRDTPHSVTSAHRFSHRTYIGEIPAGYEVDHVAARGCTRRDCTNPRHLEAVTGEENRSRYTGTHCRRAGHEYAVVGLLPNGRHGRRCGGCRRGRSVKPLAVVSV